MPDFHEPAELPEEAAAVAAQISARLQESGRTVAVAESLTSGRIASELGAAPQASAWFVGGITAYASEIKFKVLGVDPGPVITAQCARQMADGVVQLMDAGYGVAVTGAGGPDSEEGHPAGTVFAAVHRPGHTETYEYHFTGDPATVVKAATRQALVILLAAVRADLDREGTG